MISYTPFWETLKSSKESTYTLRKYYNMSSSTFHRLRHDLPISTSTLNDLCRALNCGVNDILTYVPSDEDQLL